MLRWRKSTNLCVFSVSNTVFDDCSRKMALPYTVCMGHFCKLRRYFRHCFTGPFFGNEKPPYAIVQSHGIFGRLQSLGLRRILFLSFKIKNVSRYKLRISFSALNSKIGYTKEYLMCQLLAVFVNDVSICFARNEHTDHQTPDIEMGWVEH